MRRLLALGLLVAAVAACGVPTDDTPRALPVERVPFGLLDPSPDGAPAGVPGGGTRRAVYLVQENQLVEVRKAVPGEGTPVETMKVLLAGPDSDDVADGLTTSIWPGATVLDVTEPLEGLATVNLTGDVTAAGEGLRLAFAQMVCTMTQVPGIDRVLFAFDGTPREVPDDQGQTTAEPLDCSDFAEFRDAD